MCAATKGIGKSGLQACIECAQGTAGGLKCLYDNCETGMRGQDGECYRGCELKGNCCDKK